MASKSFVISVLIFTFCSISVVHGTECQLFNFGKSSVEELAGKIVNRCPGIFGMDKEHCCYDTHLEAHCCDTAEYVLNMGIILLIVIVGLMILSSILSFICCICCPCCYCYKKRRGRIIQSPQTSHVILTRNSADYQPIVKAHIPPGAYPVFPPQPADFQYSTRSLA